MRRAVAIVALLAAFLPWAIDGAGARGTDDVPRVSEVAEDFSRNCQGCHRADGAGACRSVPRIRDFVGLFTRVPGGRDYLLRVPGVVWAMLDDARLARVLNWMLVSYSREQLAPDFRPFTEEEVRAARERPLANVLEVRSRLIAELQRRALLPPDDDGLVSAGCD